MLVSQTAAFCRAIEISTVGKAINGSSWLFPGVETIHMAAMVLLVGSITAFDLRLLGLVMRRESVLQLAARLLPCTWSAFGVSLLTGTLLFTSQAATKYCFNPAFRIKILLILLAGVNMTVFHFAIFRNVSKWDEAPATPLWAKLSGSCSVLLWAGVVIAGRWIGFA